MKVFLRHKDLHAYGKICESVHKTVHEAFKTKTRGGHSSAAQELY